MEQAVRPSLFSVVTWVLVMGTIVGIVNRWGTYLPNLYTFLPGVLFCMLFNEVQVLGSLKWEISYGQDDWFAKLLAWLGLFLVHPGSGSSKALLLANVSTTVIQLVVWIVAWIISR
jgi:hypothetical protein